MFLVGLTGGIATGKSTVADILRNIGCIILDADVIARQVVEPGKPAYKKIHTYFGNNVINDEGALNRQRLGEIIFNDEDKRRILNSITHPEIYKTMLWKIITYAVQGNQFVILDLPLLFESKKMVPFMSKIIVVACDEDQQLNRLMTRNNFNEEEALSRIEAQLPLQDKCSRATYVIDNSGSVQQTVHQVEEIHRRLKSSKTQWKFRLAFISVISLMIFGGVKIYRILLRS